jgi:predicted HD phosphohydrolase
VLEPIRLHVDAKRYRCTMENGYWNALSPASKHSLELQGGAYSVEQAVHFASQPFAQEAIRLRRYDDAAKVAGRETPAFEHFMRTLATVTARHALASQSTAAEPA